MDQKAQLCVSTQAQGPRVSTCDKVLLDSSSLPGAVTLAFLSLVACLLDQTALLTELAKDVPPMSLLSKHLLTMFLGALHLLLLYSLCYPS